MAQIVDFEIGIAEYRQIIKTINDSFGYDFSDYALTSLKRRFENFIYQHNLKHIEGLIDRLNEAPGFINSFITEILVGSTEMFRDPTFWILLRTKILPDLIKSSTAKIKILFPECYSGDELYSFVILLHEMNIANQFEIIATCINQELIDNIKSGNFKSDKFETSRDNYNRIEGLRIFTDYFKIESEKYYRDTQLINKVTFYKQNIIFDPLPNDVKLVIYRNKMIYYNQNLQDRVLKKIHESIAPQGLLAIGAKEQLGLMWSKSFRYLNEFENVFKRF